MSESFIIGIVKKKFSQFYILSEDGKEFQIYAIQPMEAVSPDYNSGKYESFLDKKVKATGFFTGGSIYSAYLELID